MNNSPTVVSVINLKGGVGKTTVTALLARFAAFCGLNVLAVDMDPQANLSQALMGEHDYIQFMDENDSSIVELFNNFKPTTQKKPSPSQLQSADIIKQAKFGYFYRSSDKYSERGTLEIIPSRFDFSDNLVKLIGLDEKMLAKFIAQNMQHKDLILIDCAPTESILTRASYHASRYILIPVKTEFFSTIGFPLMRQSINDFCNANRGHSLDVCGVLVHSTKTSGSPPSADGSDSIDDIMEKAKQYKWSIFKHTMGHSDGYPKWTKEWHAGHLGNAEKEWPKIAEEILAKIGLI